MREHDTALFANNKMRWEMQSKKITDEYLTPSVFSTPSTIARPPIQPLMAMQNAQRSFEQSRLDFVKDVVTKNLPEEVRMHGDKVRKALHTVTEFCEPDKYVCTMSYLVDAEQHAYYKISRKVPMSEGQKHPNVTDVYGILNLSLDEALALLTML